MPVTPMKIRTLQRKLYAKAKQEPGYRFYASYDKVYRADPLQHACHPVKSNKGAPDSNGVILADIEAEEGVEQFLAELVAEVRMGCSNFRRQLPGRESACLDMKHIGKPCTGKPYARFDEGGQGHLLPTLPVSPSPVSPGQPTAQAIGGLPWLLQLYQGESRWKWIVPCARF